MEINNDKVVSTNELNKVLNPEPQENSQDTVEVQFKNEIEKIDIVFIAGLILYHRLFGVNFRISYPHQFNRIFEVRQYLRQFEKIFDQNWTGIFNTFQGIKNLTDVDNVSSESFAPILLIDENSIDNIFKVTKSSNKVSELFVLRQKYIDIKISGNTNQVYLNFEEEIKKRLTAHSPIYSFVFAVLHKKIKPFKGINIKSNTKKVEKAIQRTEELWEFTQEYVTGLYELAKNIVEHSDTGEGMITIRAYDDEEMKDAIIGNKILETHVFDFGSKGVIPKLIEDTKANTHRIFSEDLEILEDDFSMHNFIKPTVKTKLNQQLYRDLAHYGLMKFYRLIEKNEGFIVSSSTGKNGERDYYTPEGSQHTKKALKIGTSYYFQLPFKHELFKTVEHPSSRVEDMQGSPQTLPSLSMLMDIFENEQMSYFQSTISINNRNDEVGLFRKLKDFKNKNESIYIAIDMENISLSSSSLLRFLAHISANYSESIIVYNLDYTLFNRMIEDNSYFYKEMNGFDDVPFWYKDKGVLLFTYVEGLNFNFADVLYGEDQQNFETINHIVSHTFPNTLVITGEGKTSNFKNFRIPNCLEPFFYQKSLLPFDLLLKKEGKILFQSNLETLLSQELISKQEL